MPMKDGATPGDAGKRIGVSDRRAQRSRRRSKFRHLSVAQWRQREQMITNRNSGPDPPSRGEIRCQFIILARKDELTPDFIDGLNDESVRDGRKALSLLC